MVVIVVVVVVVVVVVIAVNILYGSKYGCLYFASIQCNSGNTFLLIVTIVIHLFKATN